MPVRFLNPNLRGESSNLRRARWCRRPARRGLGALHGAPRGPAHNRARQQRRHVATFHVHDLLSDDELESTTRTNAIFPAQLTRRLLPHLLEPALILNICSSSARVPMPFTAAYISSKCQLELFARCLRVEPLALRKKVDCKVVRTGEVSSAGYNVAPGFLVPAAQVYARSALARAGTPGPEYNGYWRHSILLAVVAFLHMLPYWVLDLAALTKSVELLRWRQSLRDPRAYRVEDLRGHKR